MTGDTPDQALFDSIVERLDIVPAGRSSGSGDLLAFEQVSVDGRFVGSASLRLCVTPRGSST